MWILAAVPLCTVYLQDAADDRAYRSDPACRPGIAAPPIPTGGCGVDYVIVAGTYRLPDDSFAISLKFPDGARRQIPISAAGYKYLHVPGTLAFVQMRGDRIALVGDERYVEDTADNPDRRLPVARDAALVALGASLAASVVALGSRRRDARRRAAKLAT